MPARSCSMSRVELGMESVDASRSGEGETDGDSDGMDCATDRKKSSMYCSDVGSYCAGSSQRKLNTGQDRELRWLLAILSVTYINRVDIALMERSHVPIGEQPVGEQREQNEFRQCQQLISRESKSSASAITMSASLNVKIRRRTEDVPKI